MVPFFTVLSSGSVNSPAGPRPGTQRSPWTVFLRLHEHQEVLLREGRIRKRAAERSTASHDWKTI